MGCPTACIKTDCIQKFFEFFVSPEFLKFFNIKSETAEKILQNDFNCGYLSALLTVALVLVLFIIIRIVLALLFRRKRCGKVSVPSPDGELVVTRKAIESVVRKELEVFSQIQVRKLLLFKQGKHYSMKLFCQFSREGSGLPEIAQELKPRLKDVMNKLFGIDTMSDISICIEKLKADEADGDEENPSQEAAPYVDSGL